MDKVLNFAKKYKIPLISTASLIAVKYFLISGSSCKIKKDLSNKIIIITGASAGIGKQLS